MWNCGRRNTKNLLSTLVINMTGNQNAREYLTEQLGARPLAEAAVAGLGEGNWTAPRPTGRSYQGLLVAGIQRTDATASKELMLRRPKN